MYYARWNVRNLSVTLEYITVKVHKIKLQVDTGGDSTVISSLIWTEPGKRKLDGHLDVLRPLMAVNWRLWDH